MHALLLTTISSLTLSFCVSYVFFVYFELQLPPPAQRLPHLLPMLQLLPLLPLPWLLPPPLLPMLPPLLPLLPLLKP